MASWNARHREPLLDSALNDILRQRGKELLGLVLIGIGAVFAVMLGSYSPQDPGWTASSDVAVANALGRVGATVASPLMIIAGLGAWGLVAGFAGWGLRFMMHRGSDLFMGRVIFLPIVVALSSVWAATLVPAAGWEHLFGMGGVFGDTILGALVTALPLAPGTAVNVLAVGLFVAMLLAWGFVLGMVPPEARALGRFLLLGLVLGYVGAVTAVRLVAVGGARAGARAGVSAAGGLAARATRSAFSLQSANAAPAMRARGAHPGSALQGQGWDDFDGDDPLFEPTEPPHPAAHAGASGSRRSAPPILRADGPAPARRPDPSPWDHPAAQGGPAFPAAQGGHAFAAAQGGHAFAVHGGQPMPRGRAMHDTGPGAFEQDRPGLLARLKRLSQRPDDLPPIPAPELIEPMLSARALAVASPGEDRIRARISDAIRARARPGSSLQLPRSEPPVSRPAPRGPAFRPEPLLAARAPLPAPSPPASAPGGVPGGAVATVAHAAHPSVVCPAPETAPEPTRAILSSATLPDPGWFGMNLPFGLPANPVAAAAAVHGAPFVRAADDCHRDTLPDPDSAAIGAPDDAQDSLAPARTGQVYQRRVLQGATRPAAPSARARAEAQPALAFDPPQPGYELPPLSLLADPGDVQRFSLSDEALEENARLLENVLDDYGVRGEIVSVRPGPVVTMYELEPAPGLKASRVIGLADDIARSMSALSARVSTVPGRSVIGIELPNAHREKVVLREILSARDFGDSQMRLPLALGKDIGGAPVVANLAKMPHLLIAGTTGSGKSVAINTMILSLLYKLRPDECRLIMIDPKMLELSVYDGIPHLLSPVVTDPKKAVVALKWVVAEMEERYRRMSKMGVRNIEGYNGRVREAMERGEMFKRTVQTGFDDETGDPVFESEQFAPELIPYIVVVVDEMADLMMVAGKEIEACIQRLAQMARASGIHLIMATQRPSVDVITGTIKANFPTRISFQVTSKIDSRTILGEQGAEQLLGMGDMLYMAGGARITRVHGPFVSDEEVEEIVNHLKSYGPPDYIGGVVEGPDTEREADIDAVLGLGGGTDGEDALYDQAVQVVINDRKCSTSYIQRKLGIGYNKAARLVEQMEQEGLITPANHVGKREILVPERG